MSIKAKFGLGSMINIAVKLMAQNWRDFQNGNDSVKFQGIIRNNKSLQTGGKKILECLSFFGRLEVPIRIGFRTLAIDSKRRRVEYYQNGNAFSYASVRILSNFSRMMHAINSRLLSSATMGAMIFLYLTTFAYSDGTASLWWVSGNSTFIVNETDSYVPYKVRYQFNTGSAAVSTYSYGITAVETRFQVSERINNGNWTDSAVVRGSAAKSQVGAPINAEALSLSIANGHGTWYMTGTTRVTGGVYSNLWKNELDTQRFTFVPNDLSEKINKGDKVEVRIKVSTYFHFGFAPSMKIEDDFQSVVLANFSSTALSWEVRNSPHIVPDGTSTYGEVDGLVTNSPAVSFPLKYGGYEIKPDGTKTPATVGAEEELTNKYSGLDMPVGKNLQYGTWIASRHHDKFLFRPNSVEINKLRPGQTVFSALEVTAIDGSSAELGDKQTIKVVIGKSQIAVYWDNGTDFAGSGNSGIVTAEIPGTPTDVVGYMETDFNQLSALGPATSKNKWRFSLFEKTPETDDDVPPIDEAIHNNPNPKWNNAIETSGVEEVTDLEGTETKVGDSASIGTWYIREADGYTGTNYLAHTSTRQFLFRPNPDRQKELADDTSAVSYLRIQKGFCNIVNMSERNDCSLRESMLDPPIDSAVIIAVKINSPSPPKLSISGETKTLVDNGAEFTITADSRPPDNLTVNITATNTSGSFLDTSFGASGSTVGISDLSFSRVAETSTYSAKLNVPLVSDPGTTEGRLTVALVADSSTPQKYALDSTVSHTVTILKQCSSAAGDVCVSIEGNPVYTTDRTMSGFKVTASQPPGQDLEVAVTGTTNSSDMACNATIRAGRTTATKVCAIHADSPDIKFTIQGGQNYIKGKPAVAYSHFVDAAKPGITLTIEETSVAGGNAFAVKVRATHAPSDSNGLDVLISITDTGSRLVGTPPMTINIPKDATEGVLTLSTNINGTAGEEDTISVSVESNANYVVHNAMTQVVSVLNTTKPILSIAADSDTAVVRQNEKDSRQISFTLTALSKTAVNSLRIKYDTERWDRSTTTPRNGSHVFGDQSNGEMDLSFTAAETPNTYTASLVLQIVRYDYSPSFFTNQAQITAKILPSPSTYILSTFEFRSGRVKLLATPPPTLSIAGAGGVVESVGAMANFTVTSTVRTTGLTVNCSAMETNFSSAFGPTCALTFQTSGEGIHTATISVPIVSDDTVEADGDITVVLQAGTGYEISTETGADRGTVRVKDDDTRRLNAPVATISAPETVTEGISMHWEITVTLERDTAPEGNIKFWYSIPDTSNEFLDFGEHIAERIYSTAPLTLTGGNGSYSATMLRIPIVNDDDAEFGQRSYITLEPDRSSTFNYQVKASPDNVASSRILDDERPSLSISISPENKTVNEADPGDPQVQAIFTVIANVSPNKAIGVNLRISGHGIIPTPPGTISLLEKRTLDFSNGETEVEVRINVVHDRVANSHGYIDLYLAPPQEPYEYEARNPIAIGATKITVIDDDVPTIAIEHQVQDGRNRTNDLDVTEGESVSLTIVANHNEDPGGTGTFTIRLLTYEYNYDDLDLGNITHKNVYDDLGLTQIKNKQRNVYGYNIGTIYANLQFASSGVNTYTADYELSIPNNDDLDVPGYIIVYVFTSDSNTDSYNQIHAQQKINIHDDDAPYLWIESVNPVAAEESGNKVAFKIHAQGLEQATTINDVRIKVLDSEAYLTPSQQISVYERSNGYFRMENLNFTEDDGEYSALLEYDIQDNNVTDSDGKGVVTVELYNRVPITGYVVDGWQRQSGQTSSQSGGMVRHYSNPNVVASVEVVDDESLARLSITAVKEVVTEGESASFTVTATSPSNITSLEVAYSVSQIGNFIEEATDVKTELNFTATNNTNEYMATLPLQTKNNPVRGRSGSFTVSLILNSENPTYLPSTNDSSATVKVFDKDVPELSIEGGDPVIEAGGAEAVFTVTSSITVSGSIEVDYTVGTTTFATSGNYSINLPFNNTMTATFTIPIISDTNREPDGSIPVTLLDELVISTYSVSTSNMASTSVIDDDSRPILSIVASSNTELATEMVGDIAGRFTIVAEGTVPPSGLSVKFDIGETGSILTATGTGLVETVTFTTAGNVMHGSFKTNDNFRLASDTIAEVSSTVTVTLADVELQTAGYLVKPSPDNQASVKVLDDDSSELSISVLPENMTVVESDPQGSSNTYVLAKFTVSAQISPNKSLNVKFWITETVVNNYLETTGSVSAPLDFTSLSKQSTFEVRVWNDDSPGNSSVINVVLQDEDTLQNYTVDAENNSASVTVLDDDGLPRASISPTGGESAEAEENGTASFTVTLDSAEDPGEDGTFRIHYDITEGGTQEERNLYGVATSTSSDLQFTGSPGNYTAQLDIRIPNNNVLNIRGSMTVALTTNVSSPQYTVTTDADSNAATVPIFDDDAPYLTIEAGPNVIEANGAKAAFTVRARGMDTPVTLSPVIIEVTGQVDYLKPDRVSTLSFVDDGSGSFSAPLEYEILDNDIVDPDHKGEITVEIQNLESLFGYTVSPDDDASATLEVIDDESIPELSISSPANLVVAEGEAASFTITATYPVAHATFPSSDLRTVYAVIHTENDQATTTQATATLNFSTTDNPKEFTAPLQVPIGTTSQGTVYSYTVSLSPDDVSPVTYRLAATNTSVDFLVRDSNIPVLSIAGDGPVLEAEGAMANFTVSSIIDVAGSITVNYAAAASGFNNAANSSYVLEFNNSKAATLSIPIISDTLIEDDADISVTLLPKVQLATYVVSSVEGANIGTVRVLDDDSKSILSIVAAKSFALESDGDLADGFTIIAEGIEPKSPMTITFNLEETGSFLSRPGTNLTDTVTFEKIGSIYTASFTTQRRLKLDNDSTAEGTGTVTVTLVAGNVVDSPYIVKPSPGNQASVKVLDNEVPELSISLAPENRTVYENSESTPVDNNTPSINYETVELTVSTLNSPNNVLPVTLMLSEVGGAYLDSNNIRICTQGKSSVAEDFVTTGSSGTSNTVQLDFTGNKTEATLEIRICNNSAENENSVLTVELLRGRQNWVDPENNEVEFTVVDDDTVPYLTIFAPDEPVVESLDGTTPGLVTFEISSTGARKSVSVNYFVSEGAGSDFLSPSEEGEKQAEMNFDVGSLVHELAIPLLNDNMPERPGTVTVTLLPDNCLSGNGTAGSGGCYNLRSTGFSAMATIADDDAATLSIAAAEDTVTEAEGAVATFNVISRTNPRQRIIVKYIPSSEKYLEPGVSGVQNEKTLTFTDQSGGGAGPFIAELKIPIQNNSNPEADGTITVTLVESSQANFTYSIVNDASKTASVTIANDDSTALIQPVSESITEGQNAEFTVFLLPKLSVATTLVVNVSQKGDFIFTREKSLTIPSSGSAVYKVATVDDNVDEPDGEISIEIQPTDSIQLSSQAGSLAKVAVKDNDGPRSIVIQQYSVASHVIRSILLGIGTTSTDSGADFSRMSIESVSKSVEEGNRAVFRISADKAVTRKTDVLIALSQSGDYIAGAHSRTVSLAIGWSEVEFAVETQNDDLAESDGTITASIEAGSRYRVGLASTAYVKVTDVLDRLQRQGRVTNAAESIFPDLLAYSVSESFGITSERLTRAFDGSIGPQMALNGKSSAKDLVELGGEMLNDGEMDWESIIDGSSLTIPLMHECGEYNWATVWGLGDNRSFSGNGDEGSADWKSQISAGHFGFDVLVGSEFLTGLAVSLTQADTTYGSGGVEMLFNSQSTGFYPYLGYSSTNGGAQLQVMVGYGLSEIALNQEEYAPEILNGNFQAYGFSGSTRLYSSNFLLEGGSSSLSLTGESWLGQQKVDATEGVIDDTSMSASHYTIAIRGSHEQVFPMDGKVNPSLSLGLRGDGRNDLSVLGIEVESDINFEMSNGFMISGTGHTLMSKPGRINRWELGSGMNYDKNRDNLGVQFDVSIKSRGTGFSDRTTIWSQEKTVLSDNYTVFANGSRLESELGYGLELEDSGAVITPYVKFITARPGTEEFRIGGKYSATDSVSFQLENTRRHVDNETVEFKHQLNGSIRW